ncbi:MAG: VWA domain-containing protein, partial [Lentisphaeria bacterium]|nr:VIT and VWA domain-containing protein [Lentisphaeria bacterium]NQZ71256.1 VWA domain-containing protein [Lentisphaeria bacterium]
MKNIVRIMLLAAVGLIIFSCRSVNHIQNSWLIPAPHANFNGLYIVSDLVGISYSDDVWIIEKSGVEAAKKDTKAYRASLIIEVPGENKQKEFVPLPLSQTIVKGKVDGYVAKVFVTQKYKNPYDTKIEASYIFPLPQNSAVTDFIMIIGKRRIRGIIREKEEAKRIYKEARRQGYRAALMTQERPNIFTQKVANIEPQKEIDIQITYFNTLKFEEGEYEFVFPMVVGPRFNPPGSKDPIKVGTWGKGAKSIDEVMVKYLAPNQRSGHTIKLSLDIDAGVEIENVRSSSHVIDIARNANNPQKVSLALKPIDRIPNRDFILRYTVSGKKLKSALLIDKNSNDEKIFSLMLLPPKEMKYLKRQPREMIFVVDCSGSMRGKPLDKAKDAMRRCLKGLNGDDSFQIIRFSESAFSLGKVPIQATPANIRRGL